MLGKLGGEVRGLHRGHCRVGGNFSCGGSCMAGCLVDGAAAAVPVVTVLLVIAAAAAAFAADADPINPEGGFNSTLVFELELGKKRSR